MIPKIIHQTFATHDLPWFFKRGQDSVKKHFPDWEYRFYTDSELDSFVQKHYPRFYQQWLGLDRQIKRVDTARYMLLHHFGGVYADLDFVFRKPIDGLLSEDVELFSYISRQAVVKEWLFMGNALIGSVPNHSFWIDALEQMFWMPHYLDPSFHTGPRALGRIQLDSDCHVHIFSPDTFDNEKCDDGVGKAEYGVHMRAASWHPHNQKNQPGGAGASPAKFVRSCSVKEHPVSPGAEE